MGVAASKEEERNIPLEIVEEILLNLPVKSLLRFSAVSRAWTTMISDARFIRRHKTRAALPGRERILISPSWSISPTPASTCLLSSLSSSHSIAAPLFCPFENEKAVKVLASCGDLWCVELERSLFLWNPSMGKCRKLPHPSVKSWMPLIRSEFSFGMGYDSLADDYKILKIPVFNIQSLGAELYSIRSNSWRNLKCFPLKHEYKQYWEGVFVSGSLHWMSACSCYVKDYVIISFDLSTEKYAEVAQPPFHLVRFDAVNLTVLREKLCVYMNYYSRNRFVLWEMQEYGDEKSWTKMFEIDVQIYLPYTEWRREDYFKPLYFHDGMYDINQGCDF